MKLNSIKINNYSQRIIVALVLLSLLLTLSTTGSAFAQDKSTDKPAPPNKFGAIIGSIVLLVLLVIYTVIVHVKGEEGGCASCTCGRNKSTPCKNKTKETAEGNLQN